MLNRLLNGFMPRFFEEPDGVPAVTIPDDFIEEEIEEEFVYVNEGDTPPLTDELEGEEGTEPLVGSKYKGMTDEQIAAFVLAQQQAPAQGSDINALVQGLTQNMQQRPPANRDGESEAAAIAKFNKDLLESENPYAAVEALINKKLQGGLNQISGPMGQSALMALQLNPAYGHYVTYATDIQAKFNTLAPADQLRPGAAEWAYNQVINGKIPEITKAAVEKALEDKKGSGKKPDVYSSAPISPAVSGEQSVPGVKSKKVTKKMVIITAGDRKQGGVLDLDPRDLALARLRREGGKY